MDVNRMIDWLVALYPRKWRARYGEEFRALLEAEPLRAGAVLDIVRHGLMARAAAHAWMLRLALAIGSSVVVEILAVRAGVTENILWPPTTPPRALTLLVLFLPWIGAYLDLRSHVLARRAARRRS